MPIFWDAKSEKNAALWTRTIIEYTAGMPRTPPSYFFEARRGIRGGESRLWQGLCHCRQCLLLSRIARARVVLLEARTRRTHLLITHYRIARAQRPCLAPSGLLQPPLLHKCCCIARCRRDTTASWSSAQPAIMPLRQNHRCAAGGNSCEPSLRRSRPT